MQKNGKLIFLIFFLCSAIVGFGCSRMEDYIRDYEQRGLEVSSAKYDAIIQDLEQYVGKNTIELKKMLGKPSRVVSPSKWKDVEYDEEWVYAKGLIFLNKQYRIFYIKEDRVAHVEFGGIY